MSLSFADFTPDKPSMNAAQFRSMLENSFIATYGHSLSDCVPIEELKKYNKRNDGTRYFIHRYTNVLYAYDVFTLKWRIGSYNEIISS